MFKFRNLNPQGFAHQIVLVVVVLAVATVGTYLLVASHAATLCDVSGAACYPVSAPTSGNQAVSCFITNIPASVKSGAVLVPIVNVENTTSTTITSSSVKWTISQSATAKTALIQKASGTYNQPALAMNSGYRNIATYYNVAAAVNTNGIVSASVYSGLSGTGSVVATCTAAPYTVNVPVVNQ